ncbi:MAG: hypothetical protein IPH41_11265 [Sulfuritalea sp.]|jgi:hypothetical protein|nr:hypothetical protein [Sulfuritalea sp.]
MAFQSGITTSANDLLDKIRLFAMGACGYAQLMYQADAGYLRLHLLHAASGQVVNLHSYAGYIAGYGSTSFNSGAAYSSQTVASGSYSVSPLSGSAEYFLFGGDGWCYCIVQTASTTYAPFLFGAMTKTCTFTGGAFLTDTYSTYVRADIDGNTNKWKAGNSGVDVVRAFYSGITRQLDNYSPIAFNGVTPLYPATIEVGRPIPSYFYSMMGFAPGMCLLRVNGQYVNKDVVTLGGNDWMVFTLSYGGYGFLK